MGGGRGQGRIYYDVKPDHTHTHTSIPHTLDQLWSYPQHPLAADMPIHHHPSHLHPPPSAVCTKWGRRTADRVIHRQEDPATPGALWQRHLPP